VLDTTTAAIQRLSSIDRDCYTDNEFSLKALSAAEGYRYSMYNCLYSSLIEKVLTNCSCIPHYYSNYDFEGSANLKTCRGHQLICSNFWLNQMGGAELNSAEDLNSKTKRCLHPCSFQSEMLTVTSGSYPNKFIFPQRKDFCITLQKLARICNSTYEKLVFEASLDSDDVNCKDVLKANNTDKICNELDMLNSSVVLSAKKLIRLLNNYAKHNLAVVTVFIKDPYYTQILRDEAIPLVIFLGNAGGLVGLFLGISLVSFFEIFYYMFDFWLVNIYKKVFDNNAPKNN